MNRLEHLLTILGEECAEIAQAASKAKRFGLVDRKPGSDRTNEDQLRHELNDLFAVVGMLQDEGLNLVWLSGLQHQKRVKVERYLQYSRQCGTLTD